MPARIRFIIIFERIEEYFKPLEEYAEVPTTEAVKDIVVKIMVELLEIFAILTSKIKLGQAQGQASELIPDHVFPVVDRGSESSRKNFLKKFIRRKRIEDSLSRLDRLTWEAIATMKASGAEEEKRMWLLGLASLIAEIETL